MGFLVKIVMSRPHFAKYMLQLGDKMKEIVKLNGFKQERVDAKKKKLEQIKDNLKT